MENNFLQLLREVSAVRCETIHICRDGIFIRKNGSMRLFRQLTDNDKSYISDLQKKNYFFHEDLPSAIEYLDIHYAPSMGFPNVVIRIHYKLHLQDDLTLSKLGFNDNQIDTFNKTRFRRGINIVGGPPGSGKSTTIGTFATSVASNSDDYPAIYIIEHAHELHIKGAQNFKPNDYNETLKLAISSDPDIVIFDDLNKETSKIAINGAQRDIQLWASCYGRDCVDILSNISTLNREEFLNDKNYRLIVCQRLVPRLCPHCSIEITSADEQNLKELFNKTYNLHAKIKNYSGCKECVAGCKGNTLLAEMIVPNYKLLKAVVTGNIKEAYSYIPNNLMQQALSKIKTGECDPRDVIDLFYM